MKNNKTSIENWLIMYFTSTKSYLINIFFKNMCSTSSPWCHPTVCTYSAYYTSHIRLMNVVHKYAKSKAQYFFHKYNQKTMNNSFKGHKIINNAFNSKLIFLIYVYIYESISSILK